MCKTINMSKRVAGIHTSVCQISYKCSGLVRWCSLQFSFGVCGGWVGVPDHGWSLWGSLPNALHWRHNDRGGRFRSPASRLFTQSFIQAEIKENIKAPRYWPLCGELTGTGEFPAQRASNAANVSIWWRHHGVLKDSTDVASAALARRNSTPGWYGTEEPRPSELN